MKPHKALATLQSEGDALVWLLNGLHTLSREKRSKTLAMRSRRAEVGRRIAYEVQSAYEEVLRERSCHGALREVLVEPLIARLRQRGVFEMVFDPDNIGLSYAQLREFSHFFEELVRRFDYNDDGVIASTELDPLKDKLAGRVTKPPLPAFEDLGIIVPQTVFFKDGGPVLWYYTHVKRGKAPAVMRRNAQNTCLPHVLSIFENEHAAALKRGQECKDNSRRVVVRQRDVIDDETGQGSLSLRCLSMAALKSAVEDEGGERARQTWHSVSLIQSSKAAERRWEVVYERHKAQGTLSVNVCWDSQVPLASPCALVNEASASSTSLTLAQELEGGKGNVSDEDVVQSSSETFRHIGATPNTRQRETPATRQKFFRFETHRAKSNDKMLRWALESKTRAIVGAIDAVSSHTDDPMVVKRVTLAFALDEPDAAASGRHACILGASGLTLISASDAPPKTALISESPLASRGSGAQARPGRPAQGMLSCAQMMPMRACGGDHCDGSLPFYFADAFVSAGNLARVDGGARDWCPREWLYLLRHCQIGAPAGSQATGGGVEGDNVVKGVSWRMGETRNVAVAHHVPLELILDDRHRSASSHKKILVRACRIGADLTSSSDIVTQHLLIAASGHVEEEGLQVWAEYSGQVSSDVKFTLTSPGGSVVDIQRYNDDVRSGFRKGEREHEDHEHAFQTTLVHNLEIVQMVRALQGEEVHGSWVLHHPSLSARDWCPSGPAPQLLGWGISLVYSPSAPTAMQRFHSSQRRCSRPLSAGSTTLLQPIHSSRRITRPWSAVAAQRDPRSACPWSSSAKSMLYCTPYSSHFSMRPFSGVAHRWRQEKMGSRRETYTHGDDGRAKATDDQNAAECARRSETRCQLRNVRAELRLLMQERRSLQGRTGRKENWLTKHAPEATDIQSKILSLQQTVRCLEADLHESRSLHLMRLAFEALDEFDPNDETSDSDDDQLAIADSDGTDEDYSLSAADSFEISQNSSANTQTSGLKLSTKFGDFREHGMQHDKIEKKGRLRPLTAQSRMTRGVGVCETCAAIYSRIHLCLLQSQAVSLVPEDFPQDFSLRSTSITARNHATSQTDSCILNEAVVGGLTIKKEHNPFDNSPPTQQDHKQKLADQFCSRELLKDSGSRQLHVQPTGLHPQSFKNNVLDASIENGRSPLLYLASCGHSEGLELLLDAKANVHAMDADGMTALDLAMKHQQQQCVALLRMHGVKHSQKFLSQMSRPTQSGADICAGTAKTALNGIKHRERRVMGKIQVKPKIWRPSGSVQERAAEPLPGAKVVINPKSKKKMEISERYQDLLAQVLAGDVSSSQILQHLTCADAQPLIAQSQPNTVRDSISEQSPTREQAAVSNLLAADGQRWTWVTPQEPHGEVIPSMSTGLSPRAARPPQSYISPPTREPLIGANLKAESTLGHFLGHTGEIGIESKESGAAADASGHSNDPSSAGQQEAGDVSDVLLPQTASINDKIGNARKAGPEPCQTSVRGRARTMPDYRVGAVAVVDGNQRGGDWGLKPGNRPWK